MGWWHWGPRATRGQGGAAPTWFWGAEDRELLPVPSGHHCSSVTIVSRSLRPLQPQIQPPLASASMDWAGATGEQRGAVHLLQLFMGDMGTHRAMSHLLLSLAPPHAPQHLPLLRSRSKGAGFGVLGDVRTPGCPPLQHPVSPRGGGCPPWALLGLEGVGGPRLDGSKDRAGG